MINLLPKKLRIWMGLGWLDEQPTFRLHFEPTFYRSGVFDEAKKLRLFDGVKINEGFDAIRTLAITPDAHGLCGDPKRCFVFHVITPRAKTFRGRWALRRWFIDQGLAREFIDDGIVQFREV